MAHGMRSIVASVALVKISGNGLPLGSVSNGTAGGMLVPRRRTYCEAETAGMRNVIARNVEPSNCEITGFHGDPPLPLNVRTIAALGFLAASGTTERSAVVPSACSQLVLRGHSPA